MSVVGRVVGRDYRGGKLVLVVSAMKGVTDSLIRAFDNHDPDALDDALSTYIDESLNLGLSGLASFLELMREELRRFINLGEPWVRDYVVVHGELLSTLLIERVLNELLGLRAKAVYEPGIVTDDNWGFASVNHGLSSRYVVERLGSVLSKYDVAVVPGFLGVTGDGRYSSLGRGGSDYTASLLASYLNASQLTFYTESGGLLTGDPKVVSDPVLIREVGYEEVHTASILGAKRFHPRTFEPLLGSRVLTIITDPWRDDGTYVVNNCVPAPKLVSINEAGNGLFRVSVVGCRIAQLSDLRDEAHKIVSSYEVRGVSYEGPHAISALLSNWDDAVSLARDLHRWVRSWIA